MRDVVGNFISKDTKVEGKTKLLTLNVFKAFTEVDTKVLELNNFKGRAEDILIGL